MTNLSSCLTRLFSLPAILYVIAWRMNVTATGQSSHRVLKHTGVGARIVIGPGVPILMGRDPNFIKLIFGLDRTIEGVLILD